VKNEFVFQGKYYLRFMTSPKSIALGKPADFGQEIVKRRFRLTAARVSLRNKIILDFGCGNGAQTCEFIDSRCKIIAVDVTHAHLDTLAIYLRNQRRSTILPVHYDGRHLPVASGSIDLALCYDVLEHVQDESAALREIWRVLKPRGEIVLSVPNKAWFFETHGAHLPLLPWNRVPFFSWLPHAIHRRFAKARIYRNKDIRQLLHDHSFEILSEAYITAPMDAIKNPRLRKFLRATLFGQDTTRLAFLATAILVHGRKMNVARPFA
jgi:ubiquinone/menaquinone biosynthesis C-methylase UbiE